MTSGGKHSRQKFLHWLLFYYFILSCFLFLSVYCFSVYPSGIFIFCICLYYLSMLLLLHNFILLYYYYMLSFYYMLLYIATICYSILSLLQVTTIYNFYVTIFALLHVILYSITYYLLHLLLFSHLCTCIHTRYTDIYKHRCMNV